MLAEDATPRRGSTGLLAERQTMNAAAQRARGSLRATARPISQCAVLNGVQGSAVYKSKTCSQTGYPEGQASRESASDVTQASALSGAGVHT